MFQHLARAGARLGGCRRTMSTVGFRGMDFPSSRSPATTLLAAPVILPFSVRSRSLFMQTLDTPNPRSLKFVPVQNEDESAGIILQDGTAEFTSYKNAQKSPLASAIFMVDGVVGVFLTTSFATVTIDETADWLVVKPQVFAAMQDFFASGKPALLESAEVSDTAINDDDDEIVQHIKELIETRIRPSVQEDGGDIKYIGITEEGIVQLQMQGSCAGCPSSGVTLKNGIENMLMHYIPEVNGVEEWFDEESREQQAISDEALRKLEEGLAKVKKA